MQSDQQELLKFVLSASRSSLSDLWLARLNQAAILQKELQQTVLKLVDVMADARLAEFMRDHGEQLISSDTSTPLEVPREWDGCERRRAREPRNAAIGPGEAARRCSRKSA